jgi:peroxin-2
MPAADFAAAQQRLAARRAQRALSQHPQHDSTHPARASRTTTLWSTLRSRTGTRPAFRVGQVDAELLDDELLGLLKGQVGEALKHFGSHITDNWGAEILLGLRLVLFKLSIWDQNASYGAHLQGLRYTDARTHAPPTQWRKAAYGLCTIGGRYAWAKWEEYISSAQDDYAAPESSQVKFLANLTERLNSAHDVASLSSFLVFLVNGRYRTLTDRLLRLRLTPTSASTSREVSFEYLNRQLVWHAFTEFLLFLLPLVGISRWRRILGRAWRKLRSQVLHLLGRSPDPAETTATKSKSGELSFLPERTCAICYRDQNPVNASEADILASSGGGGVVGSATTDITNPYETIPCGCIYCFACVAQRIANEEGEGWSCLRCGETVKECRPWNGDVVEERRSERPESRDANGNIKSVGFAAARKEDVEALREVDPMPEHDHNHDTAELQNDEQLEMAPGLDLGESLAWTESSEWARASEESESGDEQSGEDAEDTGEEEDEEEEEDEFAYDR